MAGRFQAEAKEGSTEIRDEGYFPEEHSVLRRVQGERSVGLLYGQRALMIGALNPVNYVGTSEHTHSRHTPFKRLARTGKAFETIFFGSRAEADEVLARVHRMHERVHGEIGFDTGPYPAGTRYSAFDPELMLWTMAVMADSAYVFYELLVRRLGDEEREKLWADYLRFAELFGMPLDAAPASWDEFREWWEHTLGSSEMHLTAEARYVGRGVALAIPVSRWRRPAMPMHNLLMVGSLPARVREMYGLRWGMPEEVAFRAAAAGMRNARPLSPSLLTRGANASAFEMVAAVERRLTAAGAPPLPELIGDGAFSVPSHSDGGT